MKRSRSRLLVGFGTVSVLISLFLLFRENNVGEATGDTPIYKEFRVERGTFQTVVSASGVVKPIDRVEIKSKASGQIMVLSIERGDYVRKGDLIAKLDQRDERAELEQARANLDIAKAELRQAQLNFDRRDQLFKKGLISEEALGEIELNLAVAKGKLVQARTAVGRAEERFSESVVRAPIDGTILQKYVEEGQIIASGVSNVGGGSPIADIADMTRVHVEAGVDEIDIGKINEGQTARVVAEAYPEIQFKGKIVRIAPEAKVEQNVTLFDVIIEVENGDGKLKSGMNATVEITIEKKEDVLIAPTLVLKMPRRRKGKPDVRMAFVRQGDEFVSRKVEVGLFNFKQAEIISGLQEGDIVGVAMVSRLKQDSERLQNRIRSSRGFGSPSSSSSQKTK